MLRTTRFFFFQLWLVLALGVAARSHAELRVGIIGLDSLHAMEFTRILNRPGDPDHVPGAKVTGVHISFSQDMPISVSKVDGYTERMQRDYGLRIYATIEELAKNVDAMMILSKDGRAHLEQTRAAVPFGKPIFIDKPLAASLGDVIEIFRLGKKHRVPIFSSSSLRFSKSTLAVRHGSIGKVRSAEVFSTTYLEPNHPDLFYYGIHGVEILFTTLGVGIETVTRTSSATGSIMTEGVWKEGRIGVFREGKGYGGKALGANGESRLGKFEGFASLVGEIVKFFQTGIAPVSEEETIEIYAFMEADEVSKLRGGIPVKISEVLDLAKKPRSR